MAGRTTSCDRLDAYLEHTGACGECRRVGDEFVPCATGSSLWTAYKIASDREAAAPDPEPLPPEAYGGLPQGGLDEYHDPDD